MQGVRLLLVPAVSRVACFLFGKNRSCNADNTASQDPVKKLSWKTNAVLLKGPLTQSSQHSQDDALLIGSNKLGPHLKHLPPLWDFPGDGGHLGEADEVKVIWICEVPLHVRRIHYDVLVHISQTNQN